MLLRGSSNILDVQLPQYYREGFFSRDTLFHPELQGGRYGVAGDPVPYTIGSDSIVTSILLACFLLAVYSVANAKAFITRQTKTFFFVKSEGTTEVSETATELRFQVFLSMLTCILLALLAYLYTINFVGETFVLDSAYQLIAIYTAMAFAYFVLKVLLYTVVNSVFFGSKKNRQWLKSFLFITSIEGVMLFPSVVMLAYFNMAIKNVAIYFFLLLAIVKILTFYKSFIIFFRTNSVKLQNFLYFCTLEIIPMLSFWGALGIVADILKINY